MNEKDPTPKDQIANEQTPKAKTKEAAEDYQRAFEPDPKYVKPLDAGEQGTQSKASQNKAEHSESN